MVITPTRAAKPRLCFRVKRNRSDSLPTSPTAAVTWITNYHTNVLTPQLAVYATYAAKATALATAVTNLTNAISTAESNIKGCSISIPTILPIPSF